VASALALASELLLLLLPAPAQVVALQYLCEHTHETDNNAMSVALRQDVTKGIDIEHRACAARSTHTKRVECGGGGCIRRDSRLAGAFAARHAQHVGRKALHIRRLQQLK
jgi:hypothetical protein